MHMQVRIPMASLEESHNPKKIEDDRSHTIEACIVRIMKVRYLSCIFVRGPTHAVAGAQDHESPVAGRGMHLAAALL
jgi:hypothetical protein